MPLGNYFELLCFCLALVSLTSGSGICSLENSLVKNQVESFLSILSKGEHICLPGISEPSDSDQVDNPSQLISLAKLHSFYLMSCGLSMSRVPKCPLL